MNTQVSSQKQTITTPKVSTAGQSAAALVFGLAILFAVGFMPVEAAHNAAHDTRHAMAFPCH